MTVVGVGWCWLSVGLKLNRVALKVRVKKSEALVPRRLGARARSAFSGSHDQPALAPRLSSLSPTHALHTILLVLSCL